MAIRSFSSQLDDNNESRSIDNDAPLGLRQEFIDAAYLLFERLPSGFTDKDEKWLHNIIMQSLGIQPSGNPYGGFRYAVARDVGRVPWQRFYDVVIRIGAEVPKIFKTEYRMLVNQLLAAYRIAWEFGDDDRLHRVIPLVVANQVEGAFKELGQSRFVSALTSFREGMAAYDDRPQRGRDACKNIFDAVEAVAKTVHSMPTATFGNVLDEIRKTKPLSSETISSLQKLYDLANKHFRHGMTEPFALKPAEVDYIVVSCVGAILLFIRL